MLAKLSKPLRRYLFVGITVYVLELVIIVVAESLGASAVLAVGLSFWMGLIISFLLQKLVTFDDHRTHHKILVPQLVAFSLLVIFNFCFTIGLTKLISPPVPAVISRSIALGITVIWNFYLYKTKIFNKTEGLIF